MIPYKPLSLLSSSCIKAKKILKRKLSFQPTIPPAAIVQVDLKRYLSYGIETDTVGRTSKGNLNGDWTG